MFEFTDVLDVSYGAYVVNAAYRAAGSSNSNSVGAPSRDEAIAIIRELLRGNTAAVRQGARDASTTVSTLQTFANAVDSIAAKLTVMQELAEKAPSPDYSQVQVEEMQQQFESLAAEINETVKGTEYNYNKLFTAHGRAVSISIGNGSKIDIFARDFSFDAEGLNVGADPEGALSKIKQAIAELSEYRTYLSRQVARVEEVTAVIESEIESAMAVDLSGFTLVFASEAASYAASWFVEDRSAAVDTQANVTHGRALQLLKSTDPR